jgi:hypothetical protein
MFLGFCLLPPRGEYKVDLQRLHEVEEVTTGPFTLFLGVNVSRYQLKLSASFSGTKLLILPGPIIWDK